MKDITKDVTEGKVEEVAEQQQQEQPVSFFENNEDEEVNDGEVNLGGEEEKTEETEKAEDETQEEKEEIKEDKKEEKEEKEETEKSEEKEETEKEEETKDEKGEEEKEESLWDDVLKDEEKSEETSFDYEKLAKEHFELELDENEEDKEIAFVKAMNQKLEDSKKETKLNLEDFNEEEQEVIKAVGKGLHARDVVDKYAPVVEFLAQPDEDKVRSLKAAELTKQGIKGDILQQKVDEYIDSLTENGTFDDAVTAANNFVLQRKDAIYKDVLDDFNSKQSNADQRIKDNLEKENTQMTEILDGMNEFMGIEIPESVKQKIAKDIKTGTFHRELDNAQATLQAYMFRKIGPKAIARYEQKLKEEGGEAHRKGVEKMKDTLHNTKKTGDRSASGYNKNTTKTPGGALDFSDEVDDKA